MYEQCRWISQMYFVARIVQGLMFLGRSRRALVAVGPQQVVQLMLQKRPTVLLLPPLMRLLRQGGRRRM